MKLYDILGLKIITRLCEPTYLYKLYTIIYTCTHMYICTVIYIYIYVSCIQKIHWEVAVVTRMPDDLYY